VELADAESLSAFVDAHSPALVQFETEGCGKCAAMGPVLGGVARGTDAAVAVINPRDDPPLIDDYRISSVPTLVLFVDGAERDRLAEGFVPGDRLTEFVAEAA
jgi:thioredoxin-like negative regulator of GroEL